jgi:AraC family transcriptional regulator, regulatory protein of adaptative response / DNA-3-methyladenine glycosylase II
VARAVRLIAEGALDGEGDLEALGTRLGVGGRHLRRLFARHLGASPIAVAQTRRVHFARRLLDETALSITDVALSAGFSSVRRFNDVFRRTFGMAPSDARSRHDRPETAEVRLRLPYVPPYDWDWMLAFLRTRAIPGVEAADERGYQRSIEIGGATAGFEVHRIPGEDCLSVRLVAALPSDLLVIVERIRWQFDLDCDPRQIARHFRRDSRLALAVRKHPGLRVPGAWDPFEMAVRAILGQQVSVKAASTLAGRLVEAFGVPATLDLAGVTHRFPAAARLADADIARIGIPAARAHAIRCLAAAVAGNVLPLDGSRELDATVHALRELPGIGPWTAEYIAMRALREPDAFPAGDLGVRKALAPDRKLSQAEVLRMADPWRPFRAYAVMHLWRSLS